MKPLAMPALSKARLQYFVKLHQKKFRDHERLFLAEGLRTVRELCLKVPEEEMLVALLIRESELDAIRFAETYKGKAFSVGQKECSLLSRTSTSQGVFGVFRQQHHVEYYSHALEKKQEQSLIVALDDVQDPGNVGTILRTAAWFGADVLVRSAGTADLYNAKVVRSCAGSIYAIRHYSVESLGNELQRLQKLGYALLCSSLDGQDFREFTSLPEKIVLVIGNEANGISEPVKALADVLVRIPHHGKKEQVESLNAAVSAAILMERLVLR